MIRTLSTLAFIFLSISILAQSKTSKLTDPIVKEGKLLYLSEMASWYGTDIFLEKYKDKENIGGYFSYTENDVSHCIFFSRSPDPIVIGTISFDDSYDLDKAKTSLKERSFTDYEKALYTIRNAAQQAAVTDTIFRHYNNTNFNIIPLIIDNVKKVYVLTGPKVSGVVIFGNDYLISFNKKNEIKSIKPLHANIIPINYEDQPENTAGSMHTHLDESGDFITATDICTLMLYSKYANWSKHNVASKKYLNIWDCKNHTLTVISNKTIKKIADQ